MSITCNKLFLLALLVLASVIQTHAYNTGAVYSACDTMMPQHNTTAQTTEVPFKLHLKKACYEPGKQMSITMKADDGKKEIEGVLIQARHSDDKFHGEFMTNSNFTNFKTLECEKGKGFTHTAELKKPSFDFVWKPEADLDGEIMMTYTVVEHFKTFWVKEMMKIPKCGSSQIKGMLWMVLVVMKLVL